MVDLVGLIGATASVATALFIFLSWYDARQDRKSKILVLRFMESGKWFIRVKCKKGVVEDCEVWFAGTKLHLKGAGERAKTIEEGGGENYEFWPVDLPAKEDPRNIDVTQKGKRIFRRKYRDLSVAQ